jgi:hypothetical protein
VVGHTATSSPTPSEDGSGAGKQFNAICRGQQQLHARACAGTREDAPRCDPMHFIELHDGVDSLRARNVACLQDVAELRPDLQIRVSGRGQHT